MNYRVLITPSAKADIFEINTWFLENNPEFAENWLWGISEAISSLSKFPERCPVISESDTLDIIVRQLLYGKKPNVHRILFSIKENHVYILRVRSTRQQSFWNEIEDND